MVLCRSASLPTSVPDARIFHRLSFAVDGAQARACMAGGCQISRASRGRTDLLEPFDAHGFVAQAHASTKTHHTSDASTTRETSSVAISLPAIEKPSGGGGTGSPGHRAQAYHRRGLGPDPGATGGGSGDLRTMRILGRQGQPLPQMRLFRQVQEPSGGLALSDWQVVAAPTPDVLPLVVNDAGWQ